MKYLFKITSIVMLALTITSCEKLLNTDEEIISGKDATITENITENVTWKEGSTIIIDGTVRVGGEQAVVLIIEPGVTVKFTEGSTLEFAYWDKEYATLIAKGTADKPIIFTSNSPSPQAGDWKSINFFQGAINCELEYCNFKYGGKNEYYGNIYISETSVLFKNCNFSNSNTSGINLKNKGSFTEFTNNIFSNISTYSIKIEPSSVHSIGENNTYDTNSSIYIDGDENFNSTGEFVWKNQNIPYIIDGSMRVGTKSSQGLKITVEPGVVFKMTTGSYIDFAYWDDDYVTFIAKGTKDEPIKFTSNSPSPKTGDWKSLNFYKGAINCELDFCEFEYGGSNEYYGNIYVSKTSLSVTNCKITNSESYGIVLKTEANFTQFTKNTFYKNKLYPITLNPNAVHTLGTDNNFSSTSTILIDDDKDLTISGNYTWLNQGVPYTLDGTMRLGSVNGTTLTISAGTVIKFTSGSSIDVSYWNENNAKLIVNGTASENVTFTSNSPSPRKGDWNGIRFYSDVTGSKLNYCNISYAGGSSYGAIYLSDSGNNTVTITNSKISNSSSFGISVDDESSVNYSSVSFENNDNENYHVR